MIKITAVSYINTYPFIFGLEKAGIFQPTDYQLIKAYPSICSTYFHKKLSDVVLMPSATLCDFNESLLIKGFCIGSVRAVKSVLLLSERPIEDIKVVMLDYQSTTSVKLIKILFKYFWKKQVDYIPTSEGYEQNIIGNTAGLVIGDRAMKLASQYNYKYDLAYEWIAFTKLPFVFAYWVKTKNISEQWLKKFNVSLLWGINHKKESLDYFKSQNKSLLDYLENNISYNFDEEKIEGLKAFYHYCKKI